MDILPKDLQLYIGLSLKYLDVIALCKTCKMFYRNIYKNEMFWRNKIGLEFSKHKDEKMEMCEQTRYEHLYTFYGINRSWDEVKVDERILTNTEINFHYVWINRMPKIFRLDCLIELNLDNNCLSKLKNLYLPSLKELNVTSNSINYISKSNYYPNLEVLNLHNNELREFPEVVLLQLKTLNLSENRLTKFPKVAAPLLEILSLYSNNISSIPEIRFEHLHYLLLAHNPNLKIDKSKLHIPNIKKVSY